MSGALERRADLNQWFVHKVCMNLDRRPERWARMQERFERHGISDVVRFSAIDGRDVDVPPHWQGTAGAYGCLLSNLAVVKDARDQRWPNVLLFEDDVVFDEDFGRKLPRFIAQLPSGWDMLFFGGMHREAPLPVSENVSRLTGTTSTYAYAVRSTVYQAFLDAHTGSPEPIDVRNRQLQASFNCYCFFPHLAWVEGGASDTQGRPVNPWWLRDSLILGGGVIDDLESRTLIVIPYSDGPDPEFARRNLGYSAAAYRRHLKHATIVIVEEGAALDGAVVPSPCEHLSLDHDGAFDTARSFNEAIARFGTEKDFYVCADPDMVPTWDIRAHLLKCLDHDLASSAREVIDLTEEDSARIIGRKHHSGTQYSPRPRRGLFAEGCVVTKAAFHKSGGWEEGEGGNRRAPLSLRKPEGLSLFDSPALGMRLFAGSPAAGVRSRTC